MSIRKLHANSKQNAKTKRILRGILVLCLAHGFAQTPAHAGPIKGLFAITKRTAIRAGSGIRRAWNAGVYRPACWVSKRCEPLEGLAVCTGSGINAYVGAKNLTGR